MFLDKLVLQVLQVFPCFHLSHTYCEQENGDGFSWKATAGLFSFQKLICCISRALLKVGTSVKIQRQGLDSCMYTTETSTAIDCPNQELLTTSYRMCSYLWTDVLVLYNLSTRMWLSVGTADNATMGYAQIMSAEKFAFSFSTHLSLSSWSENHSSTSWKASFCISAINHCSLTATLNWRPSVLHQQCFSVGLCCM